SGQLLPSCGHLSQGIAIVGHVSDEHEHVAPVLERQVLRDSEPKARRKQSLDDRIAGEIDEGYGVAAHPFEGLPVERVLVVGEPEGHEYDDGAATPARGIGGTGTSVLEYAGGDFTR